MDENAGGKVYCFHETDAVRYGVHAAILLFHIRWWVAKNEANGKHQHDGRTWTYNSRKAFAELFPFLSVDQIRRAMERLVDDGVLVKGNYNKSAYDRTMWYALTVGTAIGQKCQMERAKKPNQTGEKAEPIPDNEPDTITNPLSDIGKSDGVGDPKADGFGLETPDSNTTEFDRAVAATLLDAVRTMPPRKTGLTKARPSTWANHIRLLRTRDAIPEDDIRRAVSWYRGNIGKEYVPEAYSGAAFRKKFPAIEAAAGRDLTTVTISSEAQKIGDKLSILPWPKGSADTVDAAVELGLTAYRDWCKARDAFALAMRDGQTITPKQRLALSLADHLKAVMPPPGFFVKQWMETVYERARNWPDWSGDLRPLAFKPEADAFRKMGRQWAIDYTGDPTRWDVLVDMMNKGVS